MVVYIAFIASLNLCVGYALGVYFGICPGITPQTDDAGDNDEVLGLPLTEPAPSTIEPTPTATVATEMVDQPDEPLEAPAAADTSSSVENILAGLGDFKAKLEEVSVKLAAATADRAAIDGCAGEMKEVNSKYLEQTAEVIQSLDVADSVASGTGEATLRQKLTHHTDEVRRVNNEIEGLASEQDIEKVRQMLLASSDQLTQAATVIEYSVGGTADSSTIGSSTVVSSEDIANRAMGGIDSMMALLDQELEERADDQPLVVAKLAMKPTVGVTEGDASELLRGIASLVAVELASGQAMFTDPEGQLALTLPGDDEHTASERCERIRQRVATTTFRHGEQELMADLMCSLTDTRKAIGSKDVLGRLEAGLAKAASHGPGCTIFHNGDSLTIVAPVEISYQPQVVEL